MYLPASTSGTGPLRAEGNARTLLERGTMPWTSTVSDAAGSRDLGALRVSGVLIFAGNLTKCWNDFVRTLRNSLIC